MEILLGDVYLYAVLGPDGSAVWWLWYGTPRRCESAITPAYFPTYLHTTVRPRDLQVPTLSLAAGAQGGSAFGQLWTAHGLYKYCTGEY